MRVARPHRPWPAVRADLAAMASLKQVPYPSARSLADVLLLPGTWAVLLFRASSGLHRRGHPALARLTATAGTVLFGCDLDPGAEVGPGLVLAHPHGVVVGAARVGADVRLMANVRIGGPGPTGLPAPAPEVGDRCWLFDGARVLGPARVGAEAVVSADSVVTRDVPPGSVVAGRPGRVIRFRDQCPTFDEKERTHEPA